jgi:hypothetical protein
MAWSTVWVWITIYHSLPCVSLSIGIAVRCRRKVGSMYDVCTIKSIITRGIVMVIL